MALKGEYDRQMEEGFSTAVVDGMTGFIFTNRFGMIHNPNAVNRAIKRIYENYNSEEIVNAKKEHREPVIIPHFSSTFIKRLKKLNNSYIHLKAGSISHDEVA